MRLVTYRLQLKRGKKDKEKRLIIHDLWLGVLYKDNFWHFFLDETGATVRFLPKKKKKVEKFMKRYLLNKPYTFRRHTDYIATKHEYPSIKFIADDLLPMFHNLSVLAVKYPTYVLYKSAFERLNHVFVNQMGIHDFRIEAELYMNLAFGRASLIGYRFKFPKWIYKLYLRYAKRHK